MENKDSTLINDTEDNIQFEECSICFESLKYEISTLSCRHEYHFKCLSDWQKKQNRLDILCPICRQSSEIMTIVDKCKNKPKNKLYDIDLNQNDDFNKINNPNYDIEHKTSKLLLFNCCSIL